MTERDRLPQRRAAKTISFEHGGMAYTATIGFYPDGRTGELFMRAMKGGSTLDVLARDVSIICSILLQYGCPVDVIRRAVTRNSDGSASGPIGALLDQIN